MFRFSPSNKSANVLSLNGSYGVTSLDFYFNGLVFADYIAGEQPIFKRSEGKNFMGSKGNTLKGSLDTLAGKTKQAAGRLVNDKTMEAEGLVQEGKGNLEKLAGTMSDRLKKGTQVAGSEIEKAGGKIQKI
jgi:uncharacterized protein YjbJ (UPF0337 family)